MKQLGWMFLIALVTLIVSLVQYFVTDIPGRIVFWPTLLIVELFYIFNYFKSRRVH